MKLEEKIKKKIGEKRFEEEITKIIEEFEYLVSKKTAVKILAVRLGISPVKDIEEVEEGEIAEVEVEVIRSFPEENKTTVYVAGEKRIIIFGKVFIPPATKIKIKVLKKGNYFVAFPSKVKIIEEKIEEAGEVKEGNRNVAGKILNGKLVSEKGEEKLGGKIELIKGYEGKKVIIENVLKKDGVIYLTKYTRVRELSSSLKV